MAAYAALVSVMNTMEDITNHPRLSNSFDKKQIQSLREILDSLLDFIENYTSHGSSKETRDLESQIASAACAAEDVIESHVVDQIHNGFAQNSSISSLNLKKVIEEMDYVMEKVTTVKVERGSKNLQIQHSISTAPTSSKPPITAKTTMVGFDKELIQLLDVLTRQEYSRHIISIEGMGGIGKTTLARNIFENPLIKEHFDIRGWVTISTNNSLRRILLELLSCQEIKETLEASVKQKSQVSEDELGLVLYKTLCARRYLIVLDDIWSVECWDKLKFFFPDSNNGSQILVTTRLVNVATQFCSSSFKINFLDKENSWDLFRRVTFREEVCLPELEKIGKAIVGKCKGLPLSIVAIGSFLGKSSRKKEYWENVVRDINSILTSDENEFCLNLLSLSYSHLPHHLKPCFLYMGILGEDQHIGVSQLIKLFVAEGFLKPNKIQSLEEIAKVYLKDLVDRNLILVSKSKWNGTTTSYKMHDLLREVCLREAEKEKFLRVVSVLDIPEAADMEHRRIVFHSKTPYDRRLFDALPFAGILRSFMTRGGLLPCKFRLLKVLVKVDTDPLEAVFEHVNLRYLVYQPFLDSSVVLPSSASLLWNLQTLTIKGLFEHLVAPSEIWNMKQLRHLEINQFYLPDPPQEEECGFPNLQTLLNVVNFSFSKEVCKRIPNVKKLHVKYDDVSYNSPNIDFGALNKLQALKAEKVDLRLSFTFPSSIKKLSLTRCRIDWDYVNTIGTMLPDLEVLKLKFVHGLEWNVDEGAFPHLKFLSISCSSYLINWTADESHFPLLEKLHLHHLRRLDEIPLGIGEVPTLRYLKISSCSLSAVASSINILEEQLSLDNEDIQVRVMFDYSDQVTSFKKKVEIDNFSKKNFTYAVSPEPVSFLFGPFNENRRECECCDWGFCYWS